MGLASHSWFATKEADQEHWERWEIWHHADKGRHLRKNLMDPEDGVGAGGVKLIAESSGPAAQSILTVISESQTRYPCRDRYFVLGPNSNTYPQWILDRSGWRVDLPATAIGKGATALCTEQPSGSARVALR
jgi:hypothetical protein